MIGYAEYFRIWCVLLIFNMTATVKCEIESLIDCGAENFCSRRTEAEEELSMYNYTLSGNTMASCFCDDQCSTFGDCCLDKVEEIKNGLVQKNISWTCTPLSFSQNVFTVSNCAFDSQKYYPNCEKTVPLHDYHYILDIPVFSNLSGLYYSNIYCALCHNQGSSVQPPRVTISCSSNITIAMLIEFGEYQHGKLLWKVADGYCGIQVYNQFQKGRQCLLSETNCRIDSVSENKAKCGAYSLPVLVSDKVYHNPHCAICNGAEMSDIHCHQIQKSEILHTPSIISDFKWKFDKCNKYPDFVWDNVKGKCTNLNSTSAVDNSTHDCDTSDTNDLSCQIIKQLVVRKIDAYILKICLLVSMIYLLIHMLTSFFIPQRRNVSNKMLNSLAVCSVVCQFLFLISICPPLTFPHLLCYTISVLSHFSNMSVFFWTNAISFDVFYTFSDVTLKYSGNKKYSKYAAYAWGGAAFHTLLSVVVDLTDFIPYAYRPNYTGKQNVCWFGSRNGLILFFYIPMSALILCNTFLFAITVCWFQKQHRSSENIKKGRKDYNRLCLYFKLSIAMGASWLITLLRFLMHHTIFRYLFTVFCGLQGTFIFIMFDVKKEAKFIIFCFRNLGQKQNTNIIQSTVNASSVRRRKSSVICAV